MSEIVKAESQKLSADEELKHLLKSETIRLIYEGACNPRDVDNALKNMKSRIEELKQQSYLDQSEIVRLRRQVEFLLGHDNP